VGDIAPKLAELTDQVLFGDVWARPELARRDRSLITVAALVANGSTEQLVSHLRLAKQNGLTETRTRRGDHPSRLLRRLAASHVRDHGREAGVRRRQAASLNRWRPQRPARQRVGTADAVSEAEDIGGGPAGPRPDWLLVNGTAQQRGAAIADGARNVRRRDLRASRSR
jgi:hypothetical protein